MLLCVVRVVLISDQSRQIRLRWQQGMQLEWTDFGLRPSPAGSAMKGGGSDFDHPNLQNPEIRYDGGAFDRLVEVRIWMASLT